MREERDPRVRLALLCGKIEDGFATVFRQVVLTRFEQALHAARREEGELPIERMNELWMAANRPMFGESVALTDGYAWWWLYIGHFIHSPFYCYAYAFGELLVLALLRRYDEEGDAFVPRYLALLAAGGSGHAAAASARARSGSTSPTPRSGRAASSCSRRCSRRPRRSPRSCRMGRERAAARRASGPDPLGGQRARPARAEQVVQSSSRKFRLAGNSVSSVR